MNSYHDLGTASFRVVDGRWTVDDGSGAQALTETSITDGEHTFLLVGAGGYATIQDAVDAAGEGDLILIAPGEYIESKATVHGASGLYINTAGLTLQGYSSEDGRAITSGADARLFGPTIVSGAQNSFGANHWVDAGGDGVTIKGLHLKAGEATNNKLLEIWGDDVRVDGNFIDTLIGEGQPSWAAAIYLNEVAGEPIASYLISDNVLNEGIYVGNAVGDGASGEVSETQVIIGNLFETSGFDAGDTDTMGRYDMVSVQGRIPGVGWQTDPAQAPTITGNMRSDNSAPFLFRMTEADSALFPSLAEVRALVAANTDASSTFAYVIDADTNGIKLVETDGVNRLFVANGIDTLNRFLDGTPDAVAGGRRATIETGDTIVVQPADDVAVAAIMVDDVKVQAVGESNGVYLTLATTYADGAEIPGGVRKVTLLDYAEGAGAGAGVNVIGNDLDNLIIGNSAGNSLSGEGGDDRLDGGANGDLLDGGDGIDTAVYAVAANLTSTGAGMWLAGDGDALQGVEVVEAADGRFLLVGDGGFGSINAAMAEAEDGDTIVIAAGAYDEDVVFSKAVTVLGAKSGVNGSDGSRGPADGVGETTLIGRHDITATTGAVVIDGVRFLNNATTTGGGDAGAILGVANGAGHAVRNSVFYSAVNGAANGVDDRAIFLSPAASGEVAIEDNLITGAFASGFSGGSWGRGLYFNGGGVSLDLSGNRIEYARTGVNLDMAGNSTATVEGNTFKTNGTAVSVAYTADGIRFAGNDYDNVGGDLNVRNVSDGTVFDAELAAATVTPANAQDLFQILAGSGDDQIKGTAGADHIDGNNHPTQGSAADRDTLEGRAGDDVLFGRGGNDTLDGGADDDTLVGGGGDDVLNGGDGHDTAVFSGPADAYTIDGTRDANGFYVSFESISGPDGSDTLTGVETLSFLGGGAVSLVGGVQLLDEDGNFVGAFATIQAAIDAAAANYTINVAPGEYEEKLRIDVDGLTIDGAGATLKGSLLEDYGVAAGGLFGHLTGPNASAPDTTGVGMTVSAAGVTINGLDVIGWYDAALLGDGSDDLTLNGVDFTSNLNGLRKGVDAGVTGLTINGGSFADGYVGLLIFKNTDVGNAGVGNLSDVLIDGTTFTDLARKGIYTETLSDARITGISMTNVGQFGAAAGLDGPNGTFGAGINLNLKNGAYSNVQIDRFVLTDVGASFGAGASHFGGAAIVVTARDDGGTYGPAPATFTGAIQIFNGVIAGDLATGIAVGEPGKANADPNVTVTNVTVEGEQDGASFGAVANNADGATLTFNGSADDDVIFASGNSDGPVVLRGLAGNDRLRGGQGNDTLDGGGGNDLLYGDEGADAMAGGAGDDKYFVDEAGDTVEEGANEGVDEVFASIDYELAAGVEDLTLFGSAINGTGNGSANKILGNGENNTLIGAAGDDVLIGGAGADTLIGGADIDTADYSASAEAVRVDLAAGAGSGGDSESDTLVGIENLVGSSGDDVLSGDGRANRLVGGDGGDVLDGRGGVDTMVGGAGDDVYFVDHSADATVELAGAGGGLDSVVASVSYTLGMYVENLILGGAGNFTGTGNALANELAGNSGNNVLTGAGGNDRLDGGAGSDTLVGGTGDDSFVVGAGDTVVEQANEGTDEVETALAAYTLGSNLENLTYTGAAKFTGTGNSSANTITGGAAADRLDGKAGADRLIGLAGDDVYIVDSAGDVIEEAEDGGVDLVGSTVSYTLGANVENLNLGGSSAINGAGNDLNNAIRGNNAANTLTGGGGDDMLDGGNGADRLIGGEGNDTYVVGRPDDVTVELAGEGTDLVLSDTITYTLYDDVENLTLRDKRAITGVGNALANVIIGNTSANTLEGGAGDDLLDGRGGSDTMRGGANDDTYVVDSTGDKALENAGEGRDTVRTSLTSYTLGANLENLVYLGTSSFTGTGNMQANEITGGAGSDTLDGKGGADRMVGGAGNDTYYVDDAGDVIEDTSGVDTVVTVFNDVTLTDGLENLSFNGTGAFTGTGNAVSNRITGGSGDDRLDGGAGADTLIGGAGNDTYEVDSSSDLITEAAGGGIDTVETTAANYTLGGNVENLTYTGAGWFNATGDAGSNTIRGGDQADTLNGGAGVDTLIGFDGDDVYVVDVAGDMVVESAGGGVDTVRSSAASYMLGDNVENIVLLTGGANATGNALDNMLTGNSGVNRLDGGAGADVMTGSTGNDTYVVDNVGDVVTESSKSGTDTVETSLNSYTLKTNFENLTFTGGGNFTGTGNSADNVITGGADNDTIDGGAGTDRMIGGAGNDTYYVGRAEDVVIEAAGGGVDQVLSAASSYTLAANVENLRLIDGGDDATGNALDNMMVGNSLANKLDGGAGADELRGGSGTDTFIFRRGQANGDKVADFTGAGAASGDRLQLSGYGTGASIAQVGTSDFYTITAGDGSQETIQLVGVYNLNTGSGGNDYFFS